MKKQFKDCQVGDFVKFSHDGRTSFGTLVNNLPSHNGIRHCVINLPEQEREKFRPGSLTSPSNSENAVKLGFDPANMHYFCSDDLYNSEVDVLPSSYKSAYEAGLLQSFNEANMTETNKSIKEHNVKPGDTIEVIRWNTEKCQAIYLGCARGYDVLYLLDSPTNSGAWTFNNSSYKDITDIQKVITDLKLDHNEKRFYDGGFKILKVIKTQTSFKSELKSAGYRVASTQTTAAVKAGILSLFKDRGMEQSKLNILKELLETQFGNALISYALGQGLTNVPGLKDDPRVSILAKEFRVNGIAVAGNEMMSALTKYVMPAIMDTMNSLPAVLEEPAKENNEEKIVLKKVVNAF